ncbi:MAG: hypothetical protein WDM85_12645 [Caulobacteraceae bacterium]
MSAPEGEAPATILTAPSGGAQPDSQGGRALQLALIPAKAGTRERPKTFNTKEEKGTKNTKARFARG